MSAKKKTGNNKKNPGSKTGSKTRNTKTNVRDKEYWDSIASDAGQGYGSDEKAPKGKKSEILNEDLKPDDHERGDA